MRISKTIAAIIVVLVVIFLLCVGVLVGIRVNAKGAGSNDVSLSPYSAVYLSTGDVYFGKLDWSPSPHIEDPWFLQRSTDASGQCHRRRISLQPGGVGTVGCDIFQFPKYRFLDAALKHEQRS